MKYSISSEQQAFGQALDALLGAADVPALARSWAAGDRDAALVTWGRLAELGLTALRVPEDDGGLGGTPVDVAVAFERLGFHGVPGPYVDTVVVAPALLPGTPVADLLAGIAEGEVRLSIGVPPVSSRGLDAAAATHHLIVVDGALREATPGPALASVDPTRVLHDLTPGAAVADLDPTAVARACDEAALATSATLLGAGERLLQESVGYVGARRQFGRVIGEYQAVKHALADVKVALDFARPLVHGAALALEAGSPTADRSVSAAKVATAQAAYLASRCALQAHGAIGYTLEHDLSIWILKVRALVSAWGTTAHHRERVLASITRS